MRLMAEIYTYIALASLWNLLAGYSGLVSVGQQAYVGLGAYVTFALAILFGINPLGAILIAGLVSAAIATPIAALLFRLRGAYFAIGSWVIAEVFALVASQVPALGGGSGISLPVAVVSTISSNKETREIIVYLVALLLAISIIGAIVLLLRSRFGAALTAIRDNETAARSSGVNVDRLKLIVYILAAAGTGMLGGIIFLQKLRISPSTAFSLNDWTALVIFMTVIGGIGRIEGPIIGALVYFYLRESFSELGSIYLLLLGAVAIAIMLLAPRGLWGHLADRYGIQIFPLQRRLVKTLPVFPAPTS